MKDIKIQTNGKGNIDVLTHALNIGYSSDSNHEPYILKADFVLLSDHQDIRWCTESIFNSDMSEEMSCDDFMEMGR
jgi:hypothetical protein